MHNILNDACNKKKKKKKKNRNKKKKQIAAGRCGDEHFPPSRRTVVFSVRLSSMITVYLFLCSVALIVT